ncbi:MAG TPA: hypothetical protein DCR97_00220 [Deltaproteobacteria bacterium]|nr:hypothetical protein [Deltaproteobacteria bacterium]
MKIPMLDLKREYEYMKEDIDAAIARCLQHQQWILGPDVEEFEGKVAEYIDVRHCIGASSGTDALVLALRALALKTKGQEYFDRSDLVITTPFTFTATGDAILRAGATPAFVDIDSKTFNIDPDLIRKFLSSLSSRDLVRVKGLLPVHLYGRSCEMDDIMAIANEYGLFVVEDVAQAFGGGWRGRKLGSIGTAGAFSFFPSKNLGGFGDAGMVSTNDDQIAELVRLLLKHGGKDKYNVDHIGYNARLDTLQAAVLLAKLKYVDEFNERRRRIASAYNELFGGSEGISVPMQGSECDLVRHVYHQYTIRHPERDKFREYLETNGIDSMIYYPTPLHKMKLFDEGRSMVLERPVVAEEAARSVLSLPVEPLQTQEEAAAIACKIQEFINRR